MPAWTTFSADGRVQAGEKDQFYVPYGYRFDGTRRAVVWCHGSGGDYRVGQVETWLADRLGCVWVATDLGGADTWNNDTSLARVTAAWAYATSQLAARADKMLLWGGSMGGGTALTYALDHPASVAAVGCAIPALDPEYVRVNDVGGRKALIEAIYGAGTPVPTAKQPVLRGSEWDASVAGELWYSTTDPYTPAASSETFAADSGVRAVSIGAVGHSYETDLYPPEAALAFLGGYVS